jgi:hypothetical protein
MAGGIQKEIWTDYISKNLFKNNEFLQQSNDASQYVLAGKVVHIANAGNPAAVVRNRTILPATVVKRADADITYNLDEFSISPTLIENAEKVELSYDKIGDVLSDIMSQLRQDMANWMLYNWVQNLTLSTTVNRVNWTGSASGTTYNYAPDSTGNLKRLSVEDIKAAAKLMDKLDIPGEDRYCLLDADAYFQLMDDMKPTTYKDFDRYIDPATGVIGQLYGFKFYKRSTVLYNSAGTLAAPDATSGRVGGVAMCWQKNMVERAVGEVNFFENLKDATYFGDIYSGLVRAGGRNRRNDSKGIVLLTQTT